MCISSLCLIDELSFQSFFYLQIPPLAPNIFFFFSNHQGTVFFFLLLSFLSSVLQWHHEGGNFFSEFDYPIDFSM
jgi:hypothetical protein